jgi:hypothetical protein
MPDARNSLKAYKDRFKNLKQERMTWDSMYQVLGEYISLMKQNFQNAPTSGEFLTNDIFDSTGVFAAHNAAAALLGMLWPGTAAQAIEIAPPDDLEATTETAKFYERITQRVCRAMDDPNANLSLALIEYMQDQLIFGTSGIGVERGDESTLLFKPYGVKEMYVDEGRNGRVSDVYLCFSWPVKRVVDEYGIDNVSEQTRKKYNDNKWYELVEILIVYTPRLEYAAEEGALAMPIMSLHIESKTEHKLKESGFSEGPIKVGRFKKLNYEKYGRSPAMDALPDIKEANILREAIIVATEKNLDPPLGILDDGMLGGGTIDTSAGAINVFNASGGMGSGSPVFPLVTVGSIPDALARLEELKNNITQHFHLDRLIDFNNETRMTFGEAQIRNQIRNASLTSLFSRQIAEVFTPIISRVVNMMWQMGEFGVIKGSVMEQERQAEGKKVEYIPDVIAKRIDQGEDIFQISYKTQASNAARAEEYMGIIDVLGFSIQSMQVDPSVRHRVDLHEGVKKISQIRGLPVGIIREDDEVEALKEADAQAQSMAQEAQALTAGAGIVDSLASANKAARI